LLAQALEKVADRKFINTYMLGVLSALLPVSTDRWLAALTHIFKRAREENKAVFIQGFNEGKRYDIQRKV
jgi:Pyruvate/2-oxoacid:ferredoxin oxidoreductase gamma subunit